MNTREPVLQFIEHAFPDLPGNVLVIPPTDTTNSYELMAAADLGLVYTSTTGLELATLGIPTIVSGHTHYAGKGFTIDVDTPQDFKTAIDAALDGQQQLSPKHRDLAVKYASLFFFGSPFSFPWVGGVGGDTVELRVRSLNDLDYGQDKDLDLLCSSILEGRDFGPRQVS